MGLKIVRPIQVLFCPVCDNILHSNTVTCGFSSNITETYIRDGPFDIQGGGGLVFVLKEIVCFPTGAKKIKCLQRS